MELSKRTLHQINNLRELYDFDMESRIVTVPLHYETPDDLVDEHLSRPNKPVISDEALEYLMSIIKTVPKEFAVDFSLQVDDCGDYDQEQLLLAIRTTIENTFFYHDDSKKHGNVLAVIFIILGILVLAFEYIALHYEWFGPEISLSKDIIDSLVNIIVWVLIWEGGAILFLSYDSESTLFHKDIRRFHGISLINKLGNTICALKGNTLYHKWVNPKKSERFAQNYILFSYPILLAIATISIAEIIENGSYVSMVAMIPYILDAVLMLLLTICNISFYREQGVMKKLALPLSIVLDVIMALNIASWFFDVIYWKFFIIDCFAFVMVLIEIICLIYIRKQNVNIDKNTENYLNENK